MDLGIAGRVALVTAASKGLGRGIAKALVAEGVRVAISSRSRERVDDAADQIGACGFVHDSADLDGAPELIDAVASRLGPVDILVTNTGGPPLGDPLGFGRDQWQAAYRDLVLAPLGLIALVLPGMRERGFGRILNVSSSAAREPIPGLMLSNAHRTGTLGAFKTIAREVAPDGVTLNSLLPGRIATERLLGTDPDSRERAERAAAADVPAGRLGRVDEFGAAGAFLCSAQAGYITGTTLLVDGGLTRSV